MIIIGVALLLAGCGGGQSVRHVPHLGNTPYQQDTILVTYATAPERALTLLDSALLLGNISEYRGQFIRAKIYSKSLEEMITLGQRILDRLDHYEQHAGDYAEDSYRLSWSDNPSDRDRYLDFSRAQAWGFMAIAYAAPLSSPEGDTIASSLETIEAPSGAVGGGLQGPGFLLPLPLQSDQLRQDLRRPPHDCPRADGTGHVRRGTGDV